MDRKKQQRQIDNRINDIILELVKGTKRVNIVSKYAKKWQCSDRTIDRLIKRAQPIARLKLELIEKEKEQEYVNIARESVKSNLLTKIEYEAKLNEKLRRLDEIVAGAIFKDVNDKGEVIGFRQSDFSDELKAIQITIQTGKELSDLNGWKAPTKQEITGKDGAPIIPNHEHVVIFKDYSVKGR